VGVVAVIRNRNGVHHVRRQRPRIGDRALLPATSGAFDERAARSPPCGLALPVDCHLRACRRRAPWPLAPGAPRRAARRRPAVTPVRAFFGKSRHPGTPIRKSLPSPARPRPCALAGVIRLIVPAWSSFLFPNLDKLRSSSVDVLLRQVARCTSRRAACPLGAAAPAAANASAGHANRRS